MKRKQEQKQDELQDGTRARKRTRTLASSPGKLSESPSSHPILTRFYRCVNTLHAYLLEWLPSASRIRRKRLRQFDTNHPQHSGFLRKILIGYSDKASAEIESARRDELVAFTQTQRTARGDSYTRLACDLSEILEFAIWKLFQRDAGATKARVHLLCHGYQKSTSMGDSSELVQRLQLPGIVQTARNANVEAFKQAPWTDIAGILGVDAEMIMLTLFLDCGMFQRLETGQDNLYQISGMPVFQLAPCSVVESDHKEIPKQQVGKHTPKPGSITFVRNRMLYARPSLNSHGKVQLGLKHVHILNRCNDLTDTAQDVRVMQYIFPLHFGLHSVFTHKPNPNETVQSLRDYTIREQEIASCDQRRLAKVPRHLRGRAMALVHKLRKNHSHCSYTQLLRHYCPALDSSCGILPKMSECGPGPSSKSPPFQTQLPTQKQALTTQDLGHSNYETSLIPYATPAVQVSAFCRAALLRLLPHNILGVGEYGRQNWLVLLHSIEQFISMRRYESLTLHAVCQNLKVNGIDWLRPPSMQSDIKMSKGDYTRRLKTFHEFIYYVFDSILIPLIRSNFYVTETAVYRHRVFYFRHDIWKKMVDPSLASMRLSMFRPLNSRELRQSLASNSLGYSQMRLLPKQNGVRPIINLGRKSTQIIKGKSVLSLSINNRLAPVFSVLNRERSRQPERLASAMFSVGDMQQKLRDFKSRHDHAGRKSFFFVKVDIRSCFDTIPQEELITLIRNLLKERQYQIIKHVEMKQINNSNRCLPARPVRRQILRAVGMSESGLLDEQLATRLADRKHRQIIIGANQERTISTAQVHKLLSDHLQQNVVKIGRKHFRQAEGIPQGSILSSLLCNFFYGDFEREKLKFLDPSVSLLLRLVDDFLLITTDQMQAKGFLQAICEGDTKYGISVNADKSLVNFDISVNGHKIPRVISGADFPYCGMIIESQSLRIRKDRRVRDLHVENGLTVGRAGRIGEVFRSRIVASLKRQMHAILFDAILNTKVQVFHSIFECYIESGMKLHQYLRGLDASQTPSQTYLISLCSQLISQGFKSVHSNQKQNAYQITRSQTTWLAASALCEVLARKQSGYADVLYWLRDLQRKARTSMNMTAWDCRHLISNCTKSFLDYVY